LTSLACHRELQEEKKMLESLDTLVIRLVAGAIIVLTALTAALLVEAYVEIGHDLHIHQHSRR
jgi:hypothetical protein